MQWIWNYFLALMNTMRNQHYSLNLVRYYTVIYKILKNSYISVIIIFFWYLWFHDSTKMLTNHRKTSHCWTRCVIWRGFCMWAIFYYPVLSFDITSFPTYIHLYINSVLHRGYSSRQLNVYNQRVMKRRILTRSSVYPQTTTVVITAFWCGLSIICII